jgi:hypothetical protein
MCSHKYVQVVEVERMNKSRLQDSSGSDSLVGNVCIQFYVKLLKLSV